MTFFLSYSWNQLFVMIFFFVREPITERCFRNMSIVLSWILIPRNVTLVHHKLNLFVQKIGQKILQTDNHTFLCWVVLRIYPSSSDTFFNSRHLSPFQCIKILRSIYILITPGSESVNKPKHA